MQPTLIAFQQCPILWRQMLRLGLFMLSTLNPPAVLLAQNPARGIKFERIGLEQGLSQSTVYCILQDHQGFMWFGTQAGLSKYDGYSFTAYQHDVFDSTSLSGNVVTTFFHNSKNLHSLSSDSVLAICEDRFGTLWVGTWGGGLNKFDRDQEKFTRFVHDPKNPHSLGSNRINVIYEDRYGVLWVGTYGGGLNRFHRENEQFTRFVPDPKNPHSIGGVTVWSICEDSLSRNILWVAAGGLNRFDRDTEQFTRFVNDPKNPHSLSHNYVAPLWVDRHGTLWVGTQGGGLNRFDRDTGQFTHFTTKDGLPDNQVRGILEDNQGRLWLSTSSNGLSRFDPQLKTFRNYDVSDGLASNEFVLPSQYKSADSEMFFGSFNSGFTRFHPDSIKDNPYIPSIVISSFKRYNTDDAKGLAIEEKGISAKKAIQLSYKDNVLSFEFAAPSYRITFKNQYAYKLEGFNDNWMQLGTERKVNFTNLDPGTYTLRVKGSNNDGVWNEEGTSLKITITPPWWKTWWAYTLYGLMFAGAVFGYIRYKTLAQAKELAFQRKQLEHERQVTERLRKVDKLKDDFLANTSHELRTPLRGIIGLAESSVADASVKLTDRMRLNLGMIIASGKRLASLVNDILDFSKLKTHHLAIQQKPIDMRVLVELVLKFSEPLLAGKNLILKNEIPLPASAFPKTSSRTFSNRSSKSMRRFPANTAAPVWAWRSPKAWWNCTAGKFGWSLKWDKAQRSFSRCRFQRASPRKLSRLIFPSPAKLLILRASGKWKALRWKCKRWNKTVRMAHFIS